MRISLTHASTSAAGEAAVTEMHDHHGWPSGYLKYVKICDTDYKATYASWGALYSDNYYLDGHGNKYEVYCDRASYFIQSAAIVVVGTVMSIQ